MCFLAEACADDTDLKEQVISLLQTHESAGDFLESEPRELLSSAAQTALEYALGGVVFQDRFEHEESCRVKAQTILLRDLAPQFPQPL